MAVENQWANGQTEQQVAAQTHLEYTTLPPDLAPWMVTVPSGRLHLFGNQPDGSPGILEEITTTWELEQPADNLMIVVCDNGTSTHEQIADKIQLPPDFDTDKYPVYFMTGESKEAAAQRILSTLPDKYTNNPYAMYVARKLLLDGGYGNQRFRLETFLSTLNGVEEGQHIERKVMQNDDDLGWRKGAPRLKRAFAREHGLSRGYNDAAYVSKEEFGNGVVKWDKGAPVLMPYEQVLGKTLGETRVPAFVEGRNDQNDALARTEGGTKYMSFKEDKAKNTKRITDPNARFVMAFGKKYNNPDVEAAFKLFNDVQSGHETPEMNVRAVPTGPSRTIGILTHPINMDTAHTARDWSQEVVNMLPYLITDPAISDEFGTMAYSVDGKSKTNGVRAEMCLLIGNDGLLKQISDAFGQYYLAAQVTSLFEHKRLGGAHGLRAPEAVAAFSEFLGMELAVAVRQNLKIDTSDLTVTLHDIPDNSRLISYESVQQMYNRMMVVNSEIDNTVKRLQQLPYSLEIQQSIDALLYTKVDIQRRLRIEEGIQAFDWAVNAEANKQYKYQAMVMEIGSHIYRAGSKLRYEGEYPVARLINKPAATNYMF